MPDVNLHHLSRHDENFDAALRTLTDLANTNEGPLRIKIKDGVPHIGVRSWSTFFLESFKYGDTDFKRIEKLTIDVIRSNIDPLLREAEDYAAAEAKSSQGPTAKTFSAASLTFRLRAKVVGKDLNAELGKRGWMDVSTTQPEFRDIEVNHAKGRSFNGMIVIPQGLSAGTVPVMKVVADHRLVVDIPTKVNSCSLPGVPTSVQQTEKRARKQSDEDYFFAHYFNNLSRIPSFGSGSIAIEIALGHDNIHAPEQFNSAWKAAALFIDKRKELDLPVSILLCLQGPLPRVKEQPDVISLYMGPSDDIRGSESNERYV
jgi:hypothetical protein